MQSVNGTSPNNPGEERKKMRFDVETPNRAKPAALVVYTKSTRERERKKERKRKRKKERKRKRKKERRQSAGRRRRRPVVRASHRHRMASRFHNVSRKNVPRDLSRRQ